MSAYLNLTPRPVVTPAGVVPPCGVVALFRAPPGGEGWPVVEGLPEPQPGVVYVVLSQSAIEAAEMGRTDVAYPVNDKLLRHEPERWGVAAFPPETEAARA